MSKDGGDPCSSAMLECNISCLQAATPQSWAKPGGGVVRRFVIALLALTVVTGLGLEISPPAEAFKPYTHTAVMSDVLDDLADGSVTIAGRSYPVHPDVVDSILNFPEYYRAGTIGPDGFPDPVMGQAIIHPNDAGVWLQYILDEAWANAETGSLDSGPVLAFAYGYLAHAAGDVFAHTMVNEFAGGPFPPLAEGGGLTDPENIKNALRHIVVEGYIADATLGFDGDPAPETLPGGDVSDDSTPEINIAVPVKFLKRIFTNPAARLPVGTCFDQLDDDGDGVIDDGCPGLVTPFTVGTPEPKRGTSRSTACWTCRPRFRSLPRSTALTRIGLSARRSVRTARRPQRDSAFRPSGDSHRLTFPPQHVTRLCSVSTVPATCSGSSPTPPYGCISKHGMTTSQVE